MSTGDATAKGQPFIAPLRDLLVAGAVVVYVFGFNFLDALHQRLGEPTDILSGYTLYQILIFGQILILDDDIRVMLLQLLICGMTLYIALPVVLRVLRIPGSPWLRVARYGVMAAAGFILLSALPVWATDRGQDRAESLSTRRDVMRVQLRLTSEERKQFDRNFNSCNDHFMLRYLDQYDQGVVVMASPADCTCGVRRVTYRVRHEQYSSFRMRMPPEGYDADPSDV